MSVSAISSLSGATAQADTQPAVSADAHAAFATAMAGANRRTAQPAEVRRPDDSDDHDKPAKAKGDRDDDTSSTATDSSPPQAASAPSTTSAHDAKSDRKSDSKSDGSKVDSKVRGASAGTSQASADTADATDDAGPATVGTPVDAAHLAPVLAALNDLAAGKAGVATAADASPPAPAQPAAADAAAPLPTTAALMAARAAAAPAAQTAETRAAATPARKGRDAKTSSIESLASLATTQASDAPKADAGTALAPDASQQLADGGADRQLDLAKQGAWLDGLARDIATTGAPDGTLRFQVAPQHLGTVQVEMTRGADGAAVTLTASSESSRAILADARPQLVAEAKAQGIHIANAQVDVGTDSRQQGGHSQTDHRHDARGHGLSSQMGGGGDDNGRSQTRSQPIAVNQIRDGQADAMAGEADDASAAAPVDGMYA